jgi:large subunit ribosomal protein L4
MSQVSVFDVQGKEQESLNLDVQMTEKDVNPKNFSCAINVLRQNWRQGTASCKGRGEVAFSTKKPWRQKGTGRARAGTARSPIWRKGGVTFGPQPRVKKLSINRKQIRLVLNNMFRFMIDSDSTTKHVYCLDVDFKKDGKPSSSNAFKILKNMGVDKKKSALFLPFGDEVNLLSFRNLENVNVFYFDQPNVFDLSNCDCWIFLKKDLDLFKDMVLKWN